MNSAARVRSGIIGVTLSRNCIAYFSSSFLFPCRIGLISVPAYMLSLYQGFRRNRAYLTIRYDPIAIGIFEFGRKVAICFLLPLSAPLHVMPIRFGDGARRYGDTPDGQQDGTVQCDTLDWQQDEMIRERLNGTPTGESDEIGTPPSPSGVSRGGERERPQCRLLAAMSVAFVFVLRFPYIPITLTI